MIKNKNKWTKKLTALVLSGILTVSLSSTVFARAMSLQESITEALNNNHSIKQEEADLDKAKAVLGEAQGKRGVTLTWAGSAYKVAGHYYNDLNIDHSYSNSLEASIPIYTGGQLENNVKSARLGVDISALTLKNEQQSIELQTLQAYYSILNYQNIKKVDEDTVTQYNEHVQIANAKYSAGVVPKVDLLEAEVNLANAQQDLVTADNNLQIAVTSFNKIIGQNLMTAVEPSDNYLMDTGFSKTMQECTDIAIENRPDGIASQKTVEQAETAIAAARAAYIPQVSAVAEKSIDGNNMLNNDQSDKSWYGVQASWNIFDSNVTHSQVKQAEAALVRAQQEQADTNDQIRLDVRQAYLSMDAARQNIITTKTAVDQAAENNRIADVRYQAGVGTNSDRLDAITYYTNARMNYNQALYNYTTSKAALYKAMGISAQLVAKDITVPGTDDIDAEKNDSSGLNVLDRGTESNN
ncbi:TolC family protein [Pectinatus haikarae]|uniref:Outer membrane protein TolC n=1 Tax=Pectinatus haikarae TaxID=349096 RepID=A0ABT9Y5G6_9FIRM|nr:TolC family protein [Pectinatus haikarae]MDQ0203074.1 outer membrane protein TolC [Pectinatus haikarae]